MSFNFLRFNVDTYSTHEACFSRNSLVMNWLWDCHTQLKQKFFLLVLAIKIGSKLSQDFEQDILNAAVLAYEI